MNSIAWVQLLRIKVEGYPTLYPETAIRGRLRLSGLSRKRTETIMEQILRNLPEDEYISEGRLFEMLRDRLTAETKRRFDTITRYYKMRREIPEMPPLFVALEGASGTGKSILSLELASILVITRIIGTDTIRQLMRQQTDKNQHPELFCHTYQTHEYKRVGPSSLDKIIRGYLAQCNVMRTEITGLIQRIVREGAPGLIEGVHIIPGQLSRLSSSIIEVVIDPEKEVHQQMFVSKGLTEKLTTVDKNNSKREREFLATRKIHEYMKVQAQKNNVPIISFRDFEKATEELVNLLYERIETIDANYSSKKIEK
jgi:2-phosphoglycerate kinase